MRDSKIWILSQSYIEEDYLFQSVFMFLFCLSNNGSQVLSVKVLKALLPASEIFSILSSVLFTSFMPRAPEEA